MMNTDALYLQLQNQTELALQLVDLLTDEQTALIGLQADQLIELAVAKEALVVSMDQGLRDLLNQCERAGFAATLDGLQTWLQSLGETVTQPPPAHPLSLLPSMLVNYVQALAQSQRLNHVNACLVAEQLNSLQTRIQMLCAGRHNSDMMTYGPQGNLDNGSHTGLPCVVAS